MLDKEYLAICSGSIGFLIVVIAIVSRSLEAGLIGAGVLIFAGIVENMHLSDRAAKRRAAYISYKAEKGVCDWCSGNIRGKYYSCSSCADVFCSQRCYYEHRETIHPIVGQ
jgi:hypothetical protein